MGAKVQPEKTDLVFSFLLKTETIITFKHNWTTATFLVKKARLVGTAPGRVGDNSF